MVKKLCILVFALALFSCREQQSDNANTSLPYFDIKGYFNSESIRLQKQNPAVNKTVSVNGTGESQTVTINDWQKELAIFANADINKNSWKGSFTTDKIADSTVFTSDNRKIPVKKVTIVRDNSNVKKVEIIIDNKNILFQSHDTLTYFPDSLYQIKKLQKIRLLKQKRYSITGKLK